MALTPDRPRATSAFTPAVIAPFALLGSIWGCSFLFIKIVVTEVSPLWVVAGRVAVGALFLMVVLVVRRRRLPRGRRVWLHLAVPGALGMVIPWTVVAAAEQSIPSGLAAVLNSLIPAVTISMAAAIGLERLTVVRVMGLGLALVGTTIVMLGELGVPGRLAGVLAVIGSTAGYAAATVYAKRFLTGRAPALELAAGQLLVALLFAVPAAVLFAPTPEWSQLSSGAIVSWVALGALGTGLAFALYYGLIDRVGATNASMVTYVVPPIGLFAGWLVLDEQVGWHVVLGALAIVAGIWLGQRERRDPDDAHDEAAKEPVTVGI